MAFSQKDFIIIKLYLNLAQIIISVVIIALILLQERSSGFSAVFGGGQEGFYSTRRGMERLIFSATVILIIALVGLSLFNLYK